MGYIDVISELLDHIVSIVDSGEPYVVSRAGLTGLFPPQFLRDHPAGYRFRGMCVIQEMADLYEPDLALFHSWLESCGFVCTRDDAGHYSIRKGA